MGTCPYPRERFRDVPVHASSVQPSTNETQAMPARNRSQAPSRYGLLTVAHPRIIVTQTLRSLFSHVPLTVPANIPSTSSLGAMSKERNLRGGSVTCSLRASLASVLLKMNASAVPEHIATATRCRCSGRFCGWFFIEQFVNLSNKLVHADS